MTKRLGTFLVCMACTAVTALLALTPTAAAQPSDPHMARIAATARLFVSYADRAYDPQGGMKSVLAMVEEGSEYDVYKTPGGKFLAVSLRTLTDVGARLGAALKAETPDQVMAQIKGDAALHHPMVMIELDAALARVAKVSALLRPFLQHLPAAQDAIARLDVPLATIATELRKFENVPLKKRLAALKKVPLDTLKASMLAVMKAVKGDDTPKVFEAYLRLADLEPALATGTAHAPSGQVLPFEDDSRAFRRFRFVTNTLIHHHAVVDLLLAAALVWQRAAIVQQRWPADAEDVATLVEALGKARYSGDPARAVRIQANLSGDAAFDSKQRTVSIGEWLKTCLIAVHFSVTSEGLPDIAGRRVRARELPINDGTPWETPEEESKRRADANKTTAETSAEEVLAEAKAMAVDVARTEHGYDKLVFDKSLVAEARSAVVYYGTPDIPSWATKVLVIAIADPRAATAVAITELTWHEEHWTKRPVASLQADAEQFRGRQMFGKVKPRRGVSHIPMRVLVFAR